MANNPKDNTQKSPPEREGGKAEPTRTTEGKSAESSAADSKPAASGPELATVIEQATAEDKKRIRELEERLLSQGENFERRQHEMRAEFEEFRRWLERTGPSLTRAMQPVLPEPDDDKVSVINQRNSPVTVHSTEGAIRLAPGSNLLDARTWKEAKRHPQVRHLLELGTNPFSKEGLREAGSTTKSMDLTNALLLVQAITSVDALERALVGEDRREVLAAASNQEKRIRSVEERVRGGG